MRLKIIFLLNTVLFFGCPSKEQELEGVVAVHSYFFGTSNAGTERQPLDVYYKIYFKGNKSIQEVPMLVFAIDSSKSKTGFNISHLSYLNPDKKLCINYRNFSDTAKPLKKYDDVESVRLEGGWNFLSDEKFKYKRSQTLRDTLISGVSYRRLKLTKEINGKDVSIVTYSICDRKYMVIKLFKSLSDSIGCAIIRDDTFIKDKLFMTRRLEFLSNKLSAEELKVFNAWVINENIR